MTEDPVVVEITPSITAADEVINPPYEPPPGMADVAPPVVLEEPPDPEVVALIEETALPPDPRDPPAEPPPEGSTVPPVNVDVPYLSPTPEALVGDTLNCTMGNWEGTPSVYSYLWQSQMPGTEDAPEILAGQGPSYALMETDAGKNITCIVTATNDAGATAAPPSNLTLCKEA